MNYLATTHSAEGRLRLLCVVFLFFVAHLMPIRRHINCPKQTSRTKVLFAPGTTKRPDVEDGRRRDLLCDTSEERKKKEIHHPTYWRPHGVSEINFSLAVMLPPLWADSVVGEPSVYSVEMISLGRGDPKVHVESEGILE